MNLNKGIAESDLVELLSSVDDDEGDHMLWVDNGGDVHLDLVGDHLTPAGYADRLQDRMRFRFETFIEGNEYVGPTGASDKAFVQRLLRALRANWASGFVGYTDTF